MPQGEHSAQARARVFVTERDWGGRRARNREKQTDFVGYVAICFGTARAITLAIGLALVGGIQDRMGPFYPI